MKGEPFTYLSLGAGRQSSALLVMAALGLRDCPRTDLAVFADTQAEPEWVYEHLARLTAWAGGHGVQVKVSTRGSLEQSCMLKSTGKGEGRFASIPLWTRGRDGREAPLRRQCTKEYKIEVCERVVREHLGYAPRKHMRHAVTALQGISFDERQRCKRSATPWVTNRYPLVEQGISVAGCADILERVGLPLPRKSACYFCPYHSNEYWRELKERSPGLWERACAFDEAVRDQTETGLVGRAYVHRSLVPLRVVDLTGQEPDYHKPQAGLFDSFAEECDGMCGL